MIFKSTELELKQSISRTYSRAVADMDLYNTYDIRT